MAIRIFALVVLLTAAVQAADPSQGKAGLKKLAKPPSLARAASLGDYYVSTNKATYFKAVDECLSYSLQPLQIKTSTKFNEVMNVLSYNGVKEPVYIGLTDIVQDGDWVWFDRSRLSPTLKKWVPGMGSTGLLQSCAVIDPTNSFLFSEVTCGNVYYPYVFACEPRGNP